MNLFYKLLLVTFALPLFSIAQSNYKPGYVVTLTGDTLHGYIDYREWLKNPNSINFKTTTTDVKSRVYTPADINFFNVGNFESYQSYTGKISMDATDLDHLAEGRDSSFKMSTVFFKILQKGKHLELFSYSDDLKTRFYVGENPDYTPVELVYKVYYDMSALTGRTVNEDTYLKQLFAFANKYNVLDSYLTRTFEISDYSEPAMITIISRINNISKAEYKKKYSESSKAQLFVSGGVNILTISPNNSSPYYAAGGRSNTSLGPAISFGVNLLANPNTGRLQFRADISFAEAQYKSLYESKVAPYIGVKFSFDDIRIAFMPQIIYNFYNAENFKFYGGVGFALAFHNYSNTFFGPQNTADSFNGTASNNPYYFNSLDTPLLLKAGMQFLKRYEIFINYLSAVATTKGGYFQLNNTSEQIGFIYFLK